MIQELIHYLSHIKHTWITIIGGDHKLAERIDANTVDILEARAPATSSADKEYILEQFENKSIFSHVHDEVTRARLQQNVLSIGGTIPSIRTFTEDTLWLEDSLAAMKKLIDPGKLQLRDALRHAWRGFERNSVVLEYADGLTKKAAIMIDEESQFEVASTQLWMIMMRNYPRLTSLCPKTDGKYKVAVVGPDPKCLQESARTAADLGFESTLISALLRGDPTHIYIREMLTKARSREKFDYDIERQGQAHYELLQEIHSLERRSSQSPPPLWTTTATDIKVDRRYGRPYDGALKECAPYFFLHYICQDPERGRFMTNLCVKRGIAQLFFRMPRLRLEHVLQQGVGEAAARAPAESVLAQVDDIAQAHEKIERLQRDNANQATSHAAIASKLEEAQRRIAEQHEENSTNLLRLSEFRERSARHIEEIRECQKKIVELETANKARTREESRELETPKQLHERQATIDSLKKTIADHQKLQVGSVKASQDRQQILDDLDKSRSEVASFQRRIVEYQSQCERQALDSEYLRQQLAAQTQEAMAEKQELQTILGEWERGDRRVATDTDMAGDGPSSQELQALIEELESAHQQQAKALMSARAESTLKTEGLQMMLAKTRGLREGVEKLTEYFATRLRLDPGYEGGDCETIHSEDGPPTAGDLVTIGMYRDEIEALERSISAFITLYGRADVLHHNSGIEILEWQKDVPKTQLTISNEAIDGLETNTSRMDGMLSMVKRRAGIIEQEARNTQDLQTELEAARETIDAQRQRLEALDEELREARSQSTMLEEKYHTAISSLEEALKVAQDENEAVREQAEGTSNLRAELSTAKAKNEALRNREAELAGQIKGNAEAWRTEGARIHDLEQHLTEAMSSLQATSHVQEELDKAQSDLSALRELSSSYIKDIKTANDKYKKKLEASKGRVTGLEKDLETAQQSAMTMEEELRGLKGEANKGDERVRRLKAQLLQVNRLIDLEKEKSRRETELEATLAAVAQAKADASPAQDLGDLMRREAEIRAGISRVEDGIVQTGVEILKCSNRKVRFESARTGYRRGVDHVAMEDLENMLVRLHDQVVYCFVDGTFTLVEPMRFQDYLTNPKQLADDGEFFYCDHGSTRKRRRGLDR